MNLINKNTQINEAFAQATCANVAVGFDILGFAVSCIGDTVKLTKRDDNQVHISNITSKDELPADIEKNVCSAVILKVIKELNLEIGLDIEIIKGIPLGSGMGGSAASSVASLFALNGFLTSPLTKNELVRYALHGEYIASKKRHPDNVVPCIYGGLTLIRSIDPVDVIQLPVPDNLHSIIVHPDMHIDTGLSRKMLRKELPVDDFVIQSANLSAFIVSLYENNLELMKKSLTDVLIEPYRKLLIPGFNKIKKRVLEIGALGMSLSGSGPSVFALADNIKTAETVKKEMISIFKEEGLESEGWISIVGN